MLPGLDPWNGLDRLQPLSGWGIFMVGAVGNEKAKISRSSGATLDMGPFNSGFLHFSSSGSLKILSFFLIAVLLLFVVHCTIKKARLVISSLSFGTR